MAAGHTEMERAEAIQEELVRFRRTIHAHPELSFQERQTAEFVATDVTRDRCDSYYNVRRAWRGWND